MLQIDIDIGYDDLSLLGRLLVVAAFAACAHLVVTGIRRGAAYLITHSRTRSRRKVRTLASLSASTLVFGVYAIALGFALNEFGVSVTTYLASVSILGVAIAFGSQGIVQDAITGLTVVFSDLFDVGDMVEIGGQVGIVESLGMRFTVIINAMGARVFVPNRSIGNVIAYPRGYVRCIADIGLSEDEETARRMEESARRIVAAAYEQFAGVLRTEPDYEGIHQTTSGRRYLRVKFRIWPGRGAPIETTFRQEVLQAMKAIDPAYADWLIAVNYEVERKAYTLLTVAPRLR